MELLWWTLLSMLEVAFRWIRAGLKVVMEFGFAFEE